MQQETSLLSRQIETLYRVNRYMSSIHDLDELFNLIQWEAEAAVDAEASCIAIFDPSDKNIHIEFASGEKGREVRNVSQALGQGIMGQVAATNTLLRVDDVRQDQRFDPSVDKQTGFTTRCILAAPMRRRDELLGVIAVINKRGGPRFTDEDTRLLEIVANELAVAIENARLFERLVQVQEALAK